MKRTKMIFLLVVALLVLTLSSAVSADQASAVALPSIGQACARNAFTREGGMNLQRANRPANAPENLLDFRLYSPSGIPSFDYLASSAAIAGGVSGGPKYGRQYYTVGYRTSSRAGEYNLPSIVEGFPAKFFVVTGKEFQKYRGYEDYINRMIYQDHPSHVWDDEWYYFTLPPNESLILIAVAGEFKTDSRSGLRVPSWDRYTWAYSYAFNGSKWEIHGGQYIYTVPNGGKHKVNLFGGNVQFDFYNPRNESGWTGNDIWYSFGK